MKNEANTQEFTLPKQLNITTTVPTSQLPLLRVETVEGMSIAANDRVNLPWLAANLHLITEAQWEFIKCDLKSILMGILMENVNATKRNQRMVETAQKQADARKAAQEESNLSDLKKYLLPSEAAIMAATCGNSSSKEKKFMVNLFKELDIMNPDGSWNEQGIYMREWELEAKLLDREPVNLVEVPK